jgi:hypothetical protein
VLCEPVVPLRHLIRREGRGKLRLRLTNATEPLKSGRGRGKLRLRLINATEPPALLLDKSKVEGRLRVRLTNAGSGGEEKMRVLSIFGIGLGTLVLSAALDPTQAGVACPPTNWPYGPCTPPTGITCDSIRECYALKRKDGSCAATCRSTLHGYMIEGITGDKLKALLDAVRGLK